MLPGRLESWLHQTSCIITKTLVMRIECLVVKQSDSDIIRQQLAAYFLPVGYGSPRAGGVGWSVSRPAAPWPGWTSSTESSLPFQWSARFSPCGRESPFCFHCILS